MHVIWEAELLQCSGVPLPWLERCEGVGKVKRRRAPPTRLLHPTSLCLVSRGCRLWGNWRKNKVSIIHHKVAASESPNISLSISAKTLIFSAIPSLAYFLQTCRKGNALGWCWGAKQRGRLRPKAVGESPEAPAGPDRGAAPPPGRTSTSTAGSAGSASTNRATTRGLPCL